MDTRKKHQQIWDSSSTRSFYNSPQHADFMANNGENIGLIELQGSDGFVYLPLSIPTVWTWLGKTRIPIPPVLGPRNSTYLGFLSEGEKGLGDPDVIIRGIKERNSALQPSAHFIQPVLIESGLTPGLENWVESIKSSGLTSKNTESRLVSLPGELLNSSEGGVFDFNAIVESDTYVNLLASYDSKRRYDIRRAPRVGVTLDIEVIQSGNRAAEIYESIMPLHRESWARTGLGAHTLEYWCGFSKAIRESGGHDLVVRAKHDGETVSVVVVHVRGSSAFYQMNSSSISGQKVSANPFALHAALVASSGLGAKYFELGRYSDSDSEKTRQINDYKSQFGGFVVPVPNFDLRIKPTF